MPEPPKTVFVIGPPRSGTTLLGFLLAGGPSMLSLSEPHLARAVMPDWKFQRFFRRFQRDNRLNRVHVRPRCSDEELLRSLQDLAARNGLRTLSIKETFRRGVAPANWNNADLLADLAARFPTLLLMRHPFDVAASTVKLCAWATGWRGRLCRLRWANMPNFADATAVVRWAAQNWAAYAQSLTGIGRPVLRYEDLVLDTPGRMQEVCRALGLAYDAAMLDYRRPRRAFGGLGDHGVLHRPPRPVDRSAIGRGGASTPAQREIVRAACAEYAAEHQYELR